MISRFNHWTPGRLSAALATAWLGMLVGLFVIEFPARFGSTVASYAATLDIGRVVFERLSIAEISCCILLAILTALARASRLQWLTVITIVVIVGLQSQWLLPELSQRSVDLVGGATVAPTAAHKYFGMLEMLKGLGLLMLAGFGGRAGTTVNDSQT